MSRNVSQTNIRDFGPKISSTMPPDQDMHRDKKMKVADDIGSSSPYSSLASRPSDGRASRPIQVDPLATSSHFTNKHPFVEHHQGATRSFDHDAVDYSNSKGKAVALPFRNEDISVLENIHRDAEMRDAISPSVDHEHQGTRLGGDHHDSGEDVGIDYSESHNRRKVVATHRRLRTETPYAIAGRRNMEIQDEDLESSSDEEIYREDRDESLDRRGDDYNASDNYAPDPGLRYGEPARFHWAEPVDPPVQEVRLRKDGRWDIRPGGS
ncbi:hypothetical protein BDR22DRAFT_816656 [Usnea florida]